NPVIPRYTTSPARMPITPHCPQTYPHWGETRSDVLCCSEPFRSAARTGAGALDLCRELGDLVEDRATFLHELADLLVRMHHGGVVAAAELLTDPDQRHIGEFAAQIHRDLARRDQPPRASGAHNLFDRQAEVGGRLGDDRRGGDVGSVVMGQ